MRANGIATRQRGAAVLLAAGLALACTPHAGASGPDTAADPRGNASPTLVLAPAHAVPIVYRLSRTYDAAAGGDVAAFNRIGAELGSATTLLGKLTAEDWKLARNRQALLKFTMSGGDTSILRAVAQMQVFTEAEVSLARAALAFGEGFRTEAASILSKIDARSLPAILAGHVALVKAMLAADSDPDASVDDCSDAVLLSPGTLIEEAALRLMVESAIRADNAPRFQHAAERYFRRFAKSAYLGAVWPAVARFLEIKDYMSRQEGEEFVVRLLARLPTKAGEQVLLRIAERALARGQRDLVRRVDELMAKLPSPTADARVRIDVIAGAALTVADEPAKGLERLARAQSAGTPSDLQATVVAARAFAAGITEPLARPPPHAPATAPVTPVEAERSGSAEKSAADPVESTIDKARRTLAAADKLLEGTRE